MTLPTPRSRLSSSWPSTVAEALAQQETLRAQVVADDHPPTVTAAGLNLAYDTGSDRAAAAIVVLEVAPLARVDTAIAVGRAGFPYTPGLLAFREVPLLIEAYQRLAVVPDVLVCDGHGIAHPRRIGLASHLGVLLDRPSIGVAKTPFLGAHGPLGDRRGATADIVDDGVVIGRARGRRTGCGQRTCRSGTASDWTRRAISCWLWHPVTVSQRPPGRPIPLPRPRYGKRSASAAHPCTGNFSGATLANATLVCLQGGRSNDGTVPGVDLSYAYLPDADL
jgi:deoxyribonuclease V